MKSSILFKGAGVLLAALVLSACTEDKLEVPAQVPKEEVKPSEPKKEPVVVPTDETKETAKPTTGVPPKEDIKKEEPKKQEPQKQEPQKQVPTKTDHSYLSKDFFAQLKSGKMPDSKITFNNTIPQVHKMLGKPKSKGGVEGGEIHQYDKFGYLNSSLGDKVVGIYYSTKGDKVTGEDFIKAWGKPNEQRGVTHPYDSYNMYYHFNGYMVVLEMNTGVKDEVHHFVLLKEREYSIEDTHVYLSKDFVADLVANRMPWTGVDLNLTVSQVKSKLNSPMEIREVEGGEILMYGRYGYLYPSLSEEVVGYYYFPTDGDSATGNDFVKYWGKPTSQGLIEHPYNAFIMTYEFDKYIVNVEMNSSAKDRVDHFVILER